MLLVCFSPTAICIVLIISDLIPPALCTLASLNPNLTTLRLDFCGRMNNSVLSSWSTALPHLTRLELLGPFLVYAATWCSFFESHPQLQGFLITQSPRFNLDCIQSLAENCKNLTELRLKEIGEMNDEFLEHIQRLGAQLTYLDLSDPGNPEALSTDALVDMMAVVGGNLQHLNLSKNILITDDFLLQGVGPHAHRLRTLVLANTPELTDAGVAAFFDTWADAAEGADEPHPTLVSLDMSRSENLAGKALTALLQHSGEQLEQLNINNWKATPEEDLARISEMAPRLKTVDLGWCRETNDWTVKGLLENCAALEEVKVWGCQRVTERCPRRVRRCGVFSMCHVVLILLS